ncbi:squalene synthase [Paracrocinitomix mangrovi]|uniref:squalene synthase n=1 Tax=Paracrocinitomix mangrovi TaxID=2862509 RepID=UPI001C8F101D|nr:squalene synthase [Paracrocinitomix mangrovi]UKN02484.1 squalene synthase [Paracrocinitomix mangrovi]
MKKEFSHFKPSEKRLTELSKETDDLEFCYEALKKVSRSFAVVIQQLPKELQDPVCLFYLILRGLDTVEDDMQIDQIEKEKLLTSFAERMNKEAFTLKNIGDTQDYQDLMLHFDKVLRVYHGLAPQYKEVITEITDEMAHGMNKYAHEKVISYADWDDYCYYVAGLVGIGLSKLFLASDLEKSEKLADKALSNEMGLFLQKTNIIRDFAEDLEQDRVFWPEEAWKGRVEKLEDLQKNEQTGLNVLNEMVINALNHVPACMDYLESLEDKMVFRFCAIPQLMAIATLAELYNNENVLHKNVKIRKGRTARYFMSINTFEQTKTEFVKILQSLSKQDPSQKVNNILTKVNAYENV